MATITRTCQLDMIPVRGTRRHEQLISRPPQGWWRWWEDRRYVLMRAAGTPWIDLREVHHEQAAGR